MISKDGINTKFFGNLRDSLDRFAKANDQAPTQSA
jgi:hypothetical protein